MGELRQRAAIDVDHRELGAGIAVHERPGGAEPGRGDEQADVAIRRGAGDALHLRGLGEVGREHPRRDPVTVLQLAREFGERRLPARHEDEVEPRRGELPREGAADPVGRAGHERHGSVAVPQRGRAREGGWGERHRDHLLAE